jgi:copper transport protein
VLAVIQLEHWNALWTTGYGAVLSAKLAVVCAVLMLAAYNRYRLTPALIADTPGGASRLRRSIVVECVLVVAILGLVAMWRFTPPPRVLSAANEMFLTHIHTERAMASVTISRRQANLFDISIFLQRPDEQILKGRELAITLSQPASGIEPITRLASSDGEGQWRVRGFPLPVAGTWNLALTVLIDDFDEITIDAPVSIPK